MDQTSISGDIVATATPSAAAAAAAVGVFAAVATVAAAVDRGLYYAAAVVASAAAAAAAVAVRQGLLLWPLAWLPHFLPLLVRLLLPPTAPAATSLQVFGGDLYENNANLEATPRA